MADKITRTLDITLLAEFRRKLHYIIQKYYMKSHGLVDEVNVTFLAEAADCIRSYSDPATRLQLLTEFCNVVNRREGPLEDSP